MGSFLNPGVIIDKLEIPDSASVADFGAGSGTYALAIARGYPNRSVYAIEIQRDLVDKMNHDAEREGLSNFRAVWGDIDDLHGSFLRDASIDTVLIVNTLFQLEDPETALREAYRVLRVGGTLLVIDWDGSYGNMGPHEDHVISPERVRNLLESVGFLIEEAIENPGEHHYGFIARKV